MAIDLYENTLVGVEIDQIKASTIELTTAGSPVFTFSLPQEKGSTIVFTLTTDFKPSENHLALLNIGTYTHTQIDNHIDSTSGAHAASAISVTPTGNLSSTNTQSALNELMTDIDSINSAITSGTGLVKSFNARTGVVVPQSGDYTKAQVGLTSVDDTSDLNKPISNLTQTALNTKEDLSNKSTSVTLDQASDTKYPSVKSVSDWVVLLFLQKNSLITPNTKTKITYDNKGLVTSGADATTADIADSTNKRYVTDANLTVIGNTSGTNTGDQDLSGLWRRQQVQWMTGDPLSFGTNSAGDFGSVIDFYADGQKQISYSSNGVLLKDGAGQNALRTDYRQLIDTSNVVKFDWESSSVSGTNTGDQSRESLGLSMTSLYSGGEVTGLGTATFDVAAGLGYIVSQTLAQVEPTKVTVNFAPVSSVTPLYTRGIIYVNSAGTILQIDVGTTPLTQEFKKQNIILSAYVVFGGILAAMPSLRSTPILTANKLEDFIEAIGPLNIEGNLYSANGANLLLNKSAGKTFQLKSNIANSLEVRDTTTDAAGAPIANATTAYGYRNGSGGFTLVAYTGVTPNLWDDGSGTPATVANNKFTIQRIYYFNQSNSTIIYLGQTEYTGLVNADAGVGTEARVVDDATAAATLRCSLVIKKNTTDLTNVANVSFFEASKFSASGAGSSSGTTTLQGAYNNSTTPEIITNSTLGSLTVQRGSAADTDFVLEGKNGAAATTFSVTGEGTVKGINVPNLTPTALSISFTGQWSYDWPYILESSSNTLTNGVVETYSGKWIEKFEYNEVTSTPGYKLTTLTFNDLEGTKGNFAPTAMSALTSLSAPALKVVGGNFSPNNFAINSTLSINELRVVGGNFSPQTMSNLSTLSAPNLRYVGGSVQPSIGIIATINLPELISIGLNLQPNLLTNLTTITIPKLKYIGGSFTPSTVGSIVTLSAPLLEYVGAGVNFSGIASLTTVNLPALVRVVGVFAVSGTSISSVTATSLVSVTSNFTHTAGSQTGTISYPALATVTGVFAVTGCTLATSLSAPLLTSIGSGTLNTSGSFTSINLNSLTTCLGSFTMSFASLASFSPTVLSNITTNLSLVGCSNLVTMNLSAMATYGGTITVTALTILTSATIGVIGTLKRITGATVSFSGCALTQASVDAILAVLVSLDGTNGTTLFGSGKTVTLSGGTNSTPSATGLANKAILVGRGATVTNN